LLSVTATPGNSDAADKPFTHPDGIPVGTTRSFFPDGPGLPGSTLDNTRFTVPSFPTQEVGPTLIDFGSTPDPGTNVSTRNFSIENMGGSFPAGLVQMSRGIVGDGFPALDATVTPFEGIRTSTQGVTAKL
jgi:hypothetical protein